MSAGYLTRTVSAQLPLPSRTELLACAALLLAVLFVLLAGLRRKKLRPRQAAAILLLSAFACFVLEETVFGRTPTYRRFRLELFWSWREVFTHARAGQVLRDLVAYNLLNILLFVPGGLLLPFAVNRRISLPAAFLTGAAFSALVEVLQLISCRGLFEFDDIIHNALGCAAGALAGRWVHARLSGADRKEKNG